MKSSGSITILRWGLAFVFFYAAVASLAAPDHWIIYVPSFLTSFLAPQTFLVAFSIYELLLAGFLFAGKRVAGTALCATITLAAIALVDFRLINTAYLDIGLAFAALSLFESVRK